MSNDHSANPDQKKIQLLVAGIVLLSWLILGNGGVGVASEPPFRLQVQGDRLTGVLSQVSLRTVLEKLQQKLAIEYVVPEEELDRLVSANFTGEPVIKALSKILTHWDYALQVDHEGRVHQIFVVAKAEPIEIEKNVETTSESQVAEYPRIIADSEAILQTSKTQAPLPGTASTSDTEKDTMAPMDVLAPEASHQMVIQPPQGGPMIIQPSSSFMDVIPASGYPPMDVVPAAEDAQMDFWGGHN